MTSSTSEPISQQQQQQQRRQSVALRALYTAIIFLGHFSAGIMAGVSSSTMVDLRYLLGSTDQKTPASMGQVSLLQTFLHIACCCGGFVSFLYDWSATRRLLNRQLLTGILYSVTAAYFGLLPQISSLPLAYALAAVGGLGLGNEIAIAVTWIIEMWSGTRVLAAALQALQLAYGLGTIVGPLIVRPHLFGYMNATEVAEVMSVQEYGQKIAQRRTSLTGPFIISASIVGTVGISFLVLFFVTFTRYRRPQTSSPPSTEFETQQIQEKVVEEEEEPVRLLERPENRTQLRLFLALVVAIFACNNLAEVTYFSFQDTFLQALRGSGPVRISAPEAAVISSITATAYTAGRGVNILVSMVLSAGRLLLLHYLLSVVGVGALFWTTSGSLEQTLAIKVNGVFIGYALSAIMPAMFAFIDRFALVNDRRNAVFTVALTVPNIFTPLLIGNLIERAPQVMMYLDGSVLAAAMLLFLAVKFVLLRRCKQ